MMEDLRYRSYLVYTTEMQLRGVFEEPYHAFETAVESDYTKSITNIGLGALTVGLAIVSLEGAVLVAPAILAAMALTSGIILGSFGVVELALAVSGNHDSALQIIQGSKPAVAMTSGPFSLSGGVIGALMKGKEGLEFGLAIGGVIELSLDIKDGLKGLMSDEQKGVGMLGLAKGLYGLQDAGLDAMEAHTRLTERPSVEKKEPKEPTPPKRPSAGETSSSSKRAGPSAPRTDECRVGPTGIPT